MLFDFESTLSVTDIPHWKLSLVVVTVSFEDV
jgi:hypothetical protein